MVFVDKKGDVWMSGMFARGELDWGYGLCLFAVKIEDDKVTGCDQQSREIREFDVEEFNHIPFTPISEREYNELQTAILLREPR